MKLYLDTEFNGHGGELISMAIVSAYGHSWYRARSINAEFVPWVAEHVMPKIDEDIYLHPGIFRLDFHRWIKQFDNPEIICDWHTDAEHFCRMLSGPDYTKSLDFPCCITILKTPPGQPVSANPHNALADAIALRDWHNTDDPIKATAEQQPVST